MRRFSWDRKTHTLPYHKTFTKPEGNFFFPRLAARRSLTSVTRGYHSRPRRGGPLSRLPVTPRVERSSEPRSDRVCGQAGPVYGRPVGTVGSRPGLRVGLGYWSCLPRTVVVAPVRMDQRPFRSEKHPCRRRPGVTPEGPKVAPNTPGTTAVGVSGSTRRHRPTASLTSVLGGRDTSRPLPLSPQSSPGVTPWTSSD